MATASHKTPSFTEHSIESLDHHWASLPHLEKAGLLFFELEHPFLELVFPPEDIPTRNASKSAYSRNRMAGAKQTEAVRDRAYDIMRQALQQAGWPMYFDQAFYRKGSERGKRRKDVDYSRQIWRCVSPILERAMVRVTTYGTGRDADASDIKPVLDAATDIGLWEDDSRDHLVRIVEEPAPLDRPGGQRVVIEFFALEMAKPKPGKAATNNGVKGERNTVRPAAAHIEPKAKTKSTRKRAKSVELSKRTGAGPVETVSLSARDWSRRSKKPAL